MAGWAAYAKHRDIFKSNLAICLKRQLYNSCVLPAMTYGAETWTLTKQAQNKLAAAQTKMERSMLNITYKDRRTNIWVRERTKLIDIIYTVRKMKWSWAGHINRLKDDRWTSRVTTWRPYDKKIRQGRPAKRWRDDLDKYWSDTIWQRTAQDRVIWRRHAEVICTLFIGSHGKNVLAPVASDRSWARNREVDNQCQRAERRPILQEEAGYVSARTTTTTTIIRSLIYRTVTATTTPQWQHWLINKMLK